MQHAQWLSSIYIFTLLGLFVGKTRHLYNCLFTYFEPPSKKVMCSAIVYLIVICCSRCFTCGISFLLK